MDELLTKQMPHSLEAEQAVLGSMLIDSRCIADVVSVLHASDFYVTINREIFETMLSMFNYSVPVDAVTVLQQMELRGVRRDDSQRYLGELMNVTPTAANVLEYADIVRDKSLLRSIAEAVAGITDMVFNEHDEAGDILEAAEKRIFALRQGRTRGGLEPVSSVLVGVFGQLSEAAKNKALPGLATGIPDLDRVLLGLNNSDLIILAARPGVGKTSFALNIAMHVGKTSGKAVAIFSLEMSKEQLATRLIASEAQVSSQKLGTGMLSQDDWRRITEACSIISAADIRIDDNPTLTVADMNAQCRRVSNLGLVVIDYLQLMQSADSKGRMGENRTQVVSDISRMLKIMAKELNVPVICLSQLNRAAETGPTKRPALFNLRESGSIEQDADIVLGLYRDPDTPNSAECIILKNRHGDTRTIELAWLPEYTTFAALDSRHEEDDY